ncbi:MAG: transglutaminase domain-containing protein [Promethearchaeota archaeon]|nr:MAG: transglutaminase domain-containing protein [Candidatus Lokiarchaeota archaeon]
MEHAHRKYLKSTYYMNFNEPSIVEKARELVRNIPDENDIEKGIKLFYFVRDEIKYVVKYNNEYYNRKNLKATATLDRGYGFCIQKAVLLAALARVIGIPSRLHFNDIINHMTSKKYIEYVGNDRFLYHGYTELFLGGKWVEANVAFDKDLCERKNWPIIEFDGVKPGLFAHHDDSGKPFIDYVKDHGHFPDVPYLRIVITWIVGYGLQMHGRKSKK